jgi:hypothetical protein
MRCFVTLMLMLGTLFVACDQEQTISAPELTGPAKDFVGMLAKGDYAGAVVKFDETMKGAMPVETLEQAWQSLLGKTGPFEKIVCVSQKKEQGYDVVLVTCEFENTQLDVKVVYNDKKEISGLWFQPK